MLQTYDGTIFPTLEEHGVQHEEIRRKIRELKVLNEQHERRQRPGSQSVSHLRSTLPAASESVGQPADAVECREPQEDSRVLRPINEGSPGSRKVCASGSCSGEGGHLLGASARHLLPGDVLEGAKDEPCSALAGS